MREFGLLHETDPSPQSLGLSLSLFDDCESSLPLGSNVVDGPPFTNLEEVFDPPLPSFPLIAPSFSSTLIALALVTRPYLSLPSF